MPELNKLNHYKKDVMKNIIIFLILIFSFKMADSQVKNRNLPLPVSVDTIRNNGQNAVINNQNSGKQNLSQWRCKISLP